MFKVKLTPEQSIKCFTCNGIQGGDWLIKPKNLEILPDKVEYWNSNTKYSDTYFKNEKDCDIHPSRINEWCSLENHEHIICYFYNEDEAFYFKLKYC